MHTMRPRWASLMYRAGLGATTEHSSPMTVETIDNHIYYYADVDSDRGLALMRALREKDRDLRAEQLSRGMDGAPMTPIWLHIYSIGGDLFAGFSLADQLATIKSPLYSVVEGICASAAPFIGLFGTVWGIMNSFRGMSLQGSAGIAAVAPGIAEALITTAAGIGVAIPAIVAYNLLNRRVQLMTALLDRFSSEFLRVAVAASRRAAASRPHATPAAAPAEPAGSVFARRNL